MTEEEKKAIELLKEIADITNCTTGDDLSTENAQNIINLIDSQQKRIEHWKAGLKIQRRIDEVHINELEETIEELQEEIKGLKKGNKSLIDSRKKWKDRYYKQRYKDYKQQKEIQKLKELLLKAGYKKLTLTGKEEWKLSE